MSCLRNEKLPSLSDAGASSRLDSGALAAELTEALEALASVSPEAFAHVNGQALETIAHWRLLLDG